jgi:hypothetical protein
MALHSSAQFTIDVGDINRTCYIFPELFPFGSFIIATQVIVTVPVNNACWCRVIVLVN